MNKYKTGDLLRVRLKFMPESKNILFKVTLDSGELVMEAHDGTHHPIPEDEQVFEVENVTIDGGDNDAAFLLYKALIRASRASINEKT